MSIAQATPRLDLNFLYFDTNVLIRSGWPSPSVELHNVLMLAKWSGITAFIPEPVLIEAEEHWMRDVRKKADALQSAVNHLERVAKPIPTQGKADHTPIERLLEQYREAETAAFAKFDLKVTPFTETMMKHLFTLAVQYKRPFQPDQEGKGFQDAVIFSSVVQHLKSNAESVGVLVTADSDFAQCDIADFEPGLGIDRCRILNLDKAFQLLWEPYWDEKVRKPFALENANAKVAAEAAVPMLKDFITERLSESMLTTNSFERVDKLRSVGEVKVLYVETPLPEHNLPLDRQVHIDIGVSVECTVLVEKRYDSLAPFLGWPKEPFSATHEEKKLTWLGGVEVVADIKDYELTQLKPLALLTTQELGLGKRSAAQKNDAQS